MDIFFMESSSMEISFMGSSFMDSFFMEISSMGRSSRYEGAAASFFIMEVRLDKTAKLSDFSDERRPSPFHSLLSAKAYE
jgi:hypothetical protein